jgi:hypothetical protein
MGAMARSRLTLVSTIPINGLVPRLSGTKDRVCDCPSRLSYERLDLVHLAIDEVASSVQLLFDKPIRECLGNLSIYVSVWK